MASVRHQQFLGTHHDHHWADGGEARLSNLVLICSAHHALIHEGGFSVQRRADGSCYFARPDGRPVKMPSAEDDSSSENAHEVRDGHAVYQIKRYSA
jgi:hypothetical protein